MSEVMVTFKIMPADSDTDIGKIEEQVKSKVNVKKTEKEPIAFGLVALKVTVFIMDAEGAVDKAEEDIRSIDGVGEIEVTEMTRLM